MWTPDAQAELIKLALAQLGYADLKVQIVIIAGEQDKLIDIDTQSAHLHSDVTQSKFHRVAANGHMIQQTATDQVMSAIKEVAGQSTELAASE